MLTQTLWEASPLGEADYSILLDVAAQMPLETAVHHIPLLPEAEYPQQQYSRASRVIGRALCALAEKSYVASTVLSHGGTAVFKHDTLVPGKRHDGMDWHIDIRKALVIGSVIGTELLAGDTRQLLFKPRIAAWLRQVEDRQSDIRHPDDEELRDAGLEIQSLQPDRWYELSEQIVHRAPINTSQNTVYRSFLGITPRYHIS